MGLNLYIAIWVEKYVKSKYLNNYRILDFEFPKKANDETTYVILTYNECKNFRIRMFELIAESIAQKYKKV